MSILKPLNHWFGCSTWQEQKRAKSGTHFQTYLFSLLWIFWNPIYIADQHRVSEYECFAIHNKKVWSPSLENEALDKRLHTWIHLPFTSSNWKKLLRSTPRCRLIQNRQNQRRLRSPLEFEWPAQSGAGQMKSPPNCLVEFFTLREIQSRGQPSPRSSCFAASAGVVVWWWVHQWHAALSSRLNFSHRSLSMRKEGVRDASSIWNYEEHRTPVLETWTRCNAS